MRVAFPVIVWACQSKSGPRQWLIWWPISMLCLVACRKATGIHRPPAWAGAAGGRRNTSAGDFAHYAAQIIGQPRDHYVKFSFDTSRASTPDELCEVVRVAGGLLAAVVRTASSDCLGWHPHGYFSPAGFAAIGAAEGIVHGHDIAAGLSMAWSPNPKLCEQVLSTVFPDAKRRAGAAALRTLLVETGRGERLAGEPARSWNHSAAGVRPLAFDA